MWMVDAEQARTEEGRVSLVVGSLQTHLLCLRSSSADADAKRMRERWW